MIFLIPVNESEDGQSVTVMRVDVGDVTMRVAKRKLRVVLTEWAIPKRFHKLIIKELTHE
jgi:hypothetical protein